MAILALLNRKCFRGALRYNVRGCSGGVTPDLGGNFTGLVGVPLPIARPSPRTSWSCDTLKCRAGKAKTSPLGALWTSGTAQNVNDLPKADTPLDVPLAAALDPPRGHSASAMRVALHAPCETA